MRIFFTDGTIFSRQYLNVLRAYKRREEGFENEKRENMTLQLKNDEEISKEGNELMRKFID